MPLTAPSPRLTVDRNEHSGNVDITAVGSQHTVMFSLSRAGTLQFACRLLAAFGFTSLTLNQDGTYTAR
jgi:hypothetical protein